MTGQCPNEQTEWTRGATGLTAALTLAGHPHTAIYPTLCTGLVDTVHTAPNQLRHTVRDVLRFVPALTMFEARCSCGRG